MLGQPTKGEIVYERHSIHAMRDFSQSTIEQLIAVGVIQELITPPVAAFDKLKKYGKILKKLDIETLGDFAVAPISELHNIPNAKALQNEVKNLINPYSDIDITECCGDSDMDF